MSEDHVFISIASGVAFFVQFVLLVGFVVVAVVPVRKHRPDAWLPLFGAAIVELLGTLLHRVLNLVGPQLGVRHIGSFYAGTMLLGTCINVVFWVLLLVALVKIAKPPVYDASGAPPFYR